MPVTSRTFHQMELVQKPQYRNVDFKLIWKHKYIRMLFTSAFIVTLGFFLSSMFLIGSFYIGWTDFGRRNSCLRSISELFYSNNFLCKLLGSGLQRHLRTEKENVFVLRWGWALKCNKAHKNCSFGRTNLEFHLSIYLSIQLSNTFKP